MAYLVLRYIDENYFTSKILNVPSMEAVDTGTTGILLIKPMLSIDS